MTRNVAVVVGSLRKAAWSRKMALALAGLGADRLSLSIVEIGDLPLYNEESEASVPAPWKRFRDEVRSAEAVLFVTPEYNRSVPGVLKNAIDVGSRPYGQSVWNAKPGAVVSVSPGAIGGFGAYHQLRQSLVFLNMPTLNQPETYVGSVATLFDANGELINEATGEFLTGFAKTFADWIDAHLAEARLTAA